MIDQEAEKPFVLFERLVNLVRTSFDETRIADFKSRVLTMSAKNTRDTKALSSFVKPHQISLSNRILLNILHLHQAAQLAYSLPLGYRNPGFKTDMSCDRAVLA
jgi:hypothetical protein